MVLCFLAGMVYEKNLIQNEVSNDIEADIVLDKNTNNDEIITTDSVEERENNIDDNLIDDEVEVINDSNIIDSSNGLVIDNNQIIQENQPQILNTLNELKTIINDARSQK